MAVVFKADKSYCEYSFRGLFTIRVLEIPYSVRADIADTSASFQTDGGSFGTESSKISVSLHGGTIANIVLSRCKWEIPEDVKLEEDGEPLTDQAKRDLVLEHITPNEMAELATAVLAHLKKGVDTT